MTSLAWHPEYRDPVIVLVTVAIGYAAYHYGADAELLAGRLDPRRGAEANRVRGVLLRRVAGFLLLGVVPALVARLLLGGSAGDYGVAARGLVPALAFLAGVALIVLPVVLRNARRPESWESYPELRAHHWDRRLELVNASSWILYLVGYEFFFRGFFLFSMERWVGAWPAIVLVTLVYGCVHLPKNAGEGIGSFVMGIFFGGAALMTGAIWAPLGAHVLIALSNDAAVVRANPAIELAGQASSPALPR